MAYVYHYCAMRQTSPGALEYNDGTIECSHPVDSNEQFAEIRQAIADRIGAEDPLSFTVISVTLLNLPSAAEAAETVAMMMG